MLVASTLVVISTSEPAAPIANPTVPSAPVPSCGPLGVPPPGHVQLLRRQKLRSYGPVNRSAALPLNPIAPNGASDRTLSTSPRTARS